MIRWLSRLLYEIRWRVSWWFLPRSERRRFITRYIDGIHTRDVL